MQTYLMTSPRSGEEAVFLVADSDDLLFQVIREANRVRGEALTQAITTALEDADSEEEALEIIESANDQVNHSLALCHMFDFAHAGTTRDNPNTAEYPNDDINPHALIQIIAACWQVGPGVN